MKRVIISGGGTGGHIYPALAIADALKAQHPGIDILFVGAHGKMEMEKVPQAGYAIKGLHIAGFNRKQLLKNTLLPFKVSRSLFAARSILSAFKPDLVIGVFAIEPNVFPFSSAIVPTFTLIAGEACVLVGLVRLKWSVY